MKTITETISTAMQNFNVGSVTPNSVMPSRLSSQDLMCKKTFGTGANFLTIFNPSKQCEFTRSLEDCYLGNAPALANVGNAFGRNVAEAWLTILFRDISEFAGCAQKLSPAQCASMSAIIIQEFGFLKVTEIMHFCLLFKSGKYGRFYGSVDPFVITSAFREYMRDRNEIVIRLQNEYNRRLKEEEEARHAQEVASFKERLKKQGITLEQWLEDLQKSMKLS